MKIVFCTSYMMPPLLSRVKCRYYINNVYSCMLGLNICSIKVSQKGKSFVKCALNSIGGKGHCIAINALDVASMPHRLMKKYLLTKQFQS